MAKVKDGQDALITRELYNALKRMDRPEVEAFIRTYYNKGYEKGCRDADIRHKDEATRKVVINAAAERKKHTDDLLALLSTVSGVGPATLRKINDVLGKWGGST